MTDIESRRPLVRDEVVVVLGRRDAADAEAHGSQRIEDTTIHVLDLTSIRSVGAEAAAARAVERLSLPVLDGFWCISTPMSSMMRSCRQSTTACLGAVVG